MAVEERRRRALYDALRRAIDDDNADTLMGLLPPTGWGDVATTGDVLRVREQLREEMATQGAHLRREMAALGAELRGETAELRTELRTGLVEVRGEIADLRTETRTGLAAVRTEMADLRAELHATMTANQRQVMFGLFAAITANAGVVWAALTAAA